MLPIDLIEWAKRLSTDELPSALVQISTIQSMLAARWVEASSGKHGESTAAEPDLVDAPTLAAKFNLNESWIRSRARAGCIPYVKCGRFVRFRISDVAAALEAKP